MTFLICSLPPWRLNLSFLEKLKFKEESFSSRMGFRTPAYRCQGCSCSLLSMQLHLPVHLSFFTSIQSQAPTWVLEYTEPEISGTPVLLEVTETPGGGGKRGGLAQLAAWFLSLGGGDMWSLSSYSTAKEFWFVFPTSGQSWGIRAHD